MHVHVVEVMSVSVIDPDEELKILLEIHCRDAPCLLISLLPLYVYFLGTTTHTLFFFACNTHTVLIAGNFQGRKLSQISWYQRKFSPRKVMVTPTNNNCGS